MTANTHAIIRWRDEHGETQVAKSAFARVPCTGEWVTLPRTERMRQVGCVHWKLYENSVSKEFYAIAHVELSP